MLCSYVMLARVVYGLATWPYPKSDICRYVFTSMLSGLRWPGQTVMGSWLPADTLWFKAFHTQQAAGARSCEQKTCPQCSCVRTQHNLLLVAAGSCVALPWKCGCMLLKVCAVSTLLLIPFDSRLSTHSKPLGHDFVNERDCPQCSCSKLKHSWQNYPSLLLVSCRMAPNTRVKAEQGTTYNLTTMLNLERVPISECV